MIKLTTDGLNTAKLEADNKGALMAAYRRWRALLKASCNFGFKRIEHDRGQWYVVEQYQPMSSESMADAVAMVQAMHPAAVVETADLSEYKTRCQTCGQILPPTQSA